MNWLSLRYRGEDFVRFIEHTALTLSSATIRRRVASTSTVMKLSNHCDVTKSTNAVLALKRMHRQTGRAQKQALPLTREVLEKLLSVCDDSSRGRRDRLMLRLGYKTMRRRAELCSLKCEDREILPSGKAALRLRFSKTDL